MSALVVHLARPEDLPRLLAAARDGDVVIGSRWVRGGSVVNWPRRRKAPGRAPPQFSRRYRA